MKNRKITTEKLNTKTMRQLRKAIKDIKKGKNLSPVFHTVAEMRKYLNN